MMGFSVDTSFLLSLQGQPNNVWRNQEGDGKRERITEAWNARHNGEALVVVCDTHPVVVFSSARDAE